ncbi:unnamed protein product, partial [Owenia fusiformis]
SFDSSGSIARIDNLSKDSSFVFRVSALYQYEANDVRMGILSDWSDPFITCGDPTYSTLNATYDFAITPSLNHTGPSTLTTKLTWMRPIEDEIKCDDIQTYNIYRNGEYLRGAIGMNIELPKNDFELDTQYNVEISMVNNANLEGPKTLVFDTVTPADKPSSPRDLRMLASDVNSFYLAWKTPRFTNGRLQQYQVTCYVNTTYAVIKQTLSSETRETFVSNLEIGTTYECAVKASTRAGYGPVVQGYFQTTKEGTSDNTMQPNTKQLVGAIVGVTVASVLCILVLIVIIAVLFRKIRRNTSEGKR